MVTIDVPEELDHEAPYELVRRLRASIAVLGPLVARCRKASVALPGGDAIGSRGLDMHIHGLQELGAAVRIEHGQVVAEVPQGLVGANLWLDFPSVGATENLVMAAVLAKGTTVIDNVAREPEIVDLCHMLEAMGARIDGVSTSTLVIEGVEKLQPVEHRTVTDRIVTGTWVFAAAIAGGDLHIEGGVAHHLDIVLDKLVASGAEVEQTESGLTVRAHRRLTSFDVATLPYPGFPTDLQPFAMALAAVSDGTAMITENVFEARFMFAQELARLGADLRTDGHHAVVRGVPMLSGAPGDRPRHPRRCRPGAGRARGPGDHRGGRVPAHRSRLSDVRRGACGRRSRRNPSICLDRHGRGLLRKVPSSTGLSVHDRESRYANVSSASILGSKSVEALYGADDNRQHARALGLARRAVHRLRCAPPSTASWTSATVTSTWTSPRSSRST